MATKTIVSPPPSNEKRSAVNGFHTQRDLADGVESANGRAVSEELYWAEYYDHPSFSYEWNDGKLEVKPVGNYAQFHVYLWFLALLKDYLHAHNNARMIGLEMGFRMKLPGKTTIRKPDLAVVLNSNPVPLGDKDRSYGGIFDICIESLSDSTRQEVERDTKVKKLEYAQAGVREYYILDENRKETIFYQRGEQGVYAPIPLRDGVIESAVLPGFRLRVSDLYTLPEAPAMLDDPIYQSFTSPFVRAERLRADRYKAMLIELGISPDEL